MVPSWRALLDVVLAAYRWVNAVSYGVVLPACAVWIVVMAGASLPESLAAARGEGDPGVFVAGVRTCAEHTCSWTGRFVADDGSPVLARVLLDSALPDRPGDTVRVLHEGELDPAVVYLAEGSRDWLYTLGLMGLGLAYLGWGAWWLDRRGLLPGRPRPFRGPFG